MNTIDSLLRHIDASKARYDRDKLLGFLFEFAYEFSHYAKLPQSQLSYESIVSWKLAGIANYCRQQYEKCPRVAYMNLNIPDYGIIKATMPHELKNWHAYWERISQQNPRLK